jgi:hypothetical protein
MMHHPPEEAWAKAHAGELFRALLACLAVFTLAACDDRQQQVENDVARAPGVEEREMTEPRNTRGVPVHPDNEAALPPEQLLTPVLADASERSGVPPAQLVVKGAWRRTWSDGSLGCPRPGEFYTQALVPGWQVIVQAGDQELDYRLADRGHFILCPPGLALDGGFINER